MPRPSKAYQFIGWTALVAALVLIVLVENRTMAMRLVVVLIGAAFAAGYVYQWIYHRKR